MIGVSDIVAAVMKAGEWTRIVELAERVPELEKRIAALEARDGIGKLKFSCSVCGSAASVVAERPDRHFGSTGLKTLDIVCNNPQCQTKSTRQLDTNKR